MVAAYVPGILSRPATRCRAAGFARLMTAARDQLAGEGIRARVVSMPCVEWFNDQDESYRREVLPPTIPARVSVEAGITAPWK